MIFIFRIVLLLIFLNVSAFASDNKLNGRAVMAKVYDQSNKNKNKISNVKLVIIDEEKNERVRFFRLKTKITAEGDKSIIKFYEPVNVKGTALLTHKIKSSNETLQWIYFSSFKSLKAISSEEKDQSFMGSDFFYSDLAGRTLDQDTHQLVKEDDQYYYVRSIPNDKGSYSQLDIIVSKANNVALKISFYNANKEVFKVLTNEKVAKIGGAFEVVFARMKNLSSGGSSTIEKNDVDITKIIKDEEVSIKALSLD